MPRHSYREHDYTFGQAMLRLRKRLRLTQAGLADLLGVSRRAVGEWEGGLNYPREDHLQHLLELCVQQHVFAPEREEEEIRALWETAHQRVFLDERWLSNLLRPQQPPPPAQQSDEQTHADEHAAARPVLDAHAFSGREGAGDATMSEAALLRDRLLTTKFFIPSPSHALIPRPRLTTQLRASLQHKLTLVSAPPGFGKTTLLSAWLQSLPSGNPHVAWVSLDEGDNDPLRFWEYALTALDNCKPGLYTSLLTFLHTQPSLSVPYLLTALINTLVKQTEQFLLVLDDYHVITEPEVHGSLTYLLEHLPPQLHLILATRADPPVSLSRLRARNQVFEVRTEQLRCTSEEALAFFTQAMRIPLTSEEIREVEIRTEGWLAGLQLLALSMRGRTDPSVLLADVHGTHHYILDYLTDEVLRQQPAALQTFLLRTSILERHCAPLCDRVMGQSGSQLVLEHLEQANLFVVALDGQRQWYRYHALFAETLRYRLQQAEGEAVAALAKSLAYHALGDIVPAIQSAREATAQAQAIGTILAYMCRTAYSLRLHGKLHEVVQMAQLVARRGTTSVGLPHAMVCWAYIIHADVLREWNRLDEALFLALQGVQLSEQTEMIVAFYFAYSVLMRVYQARGELDAARLAFQKSEATLAQNYSPYRRSIFLIVEWVQFWLAAGEVARATLWAQELVQQPREPSPLAREREDMARARILLAQEKPTEALWLLEPLQSGAQRQGRWNQLIEMQVLQALALSMGDEEQEALAVLAQALQLAEPEGYIRIFVDEGAPMARLLSRLREQEDRQVPTGYVDTLLAAFGEVGGVHDDATGAGPL
jgi:ATP/maltotriose-dependent transcriptional regulator MalT/transcriptional regulator with XRE-family HTH domain